MSMLSSLFGQKSELPAWQCTIPRRQPPVNDEIGSWLYIVVDPKGLIPQDQPSYNKDGQSAFQKLRQGELVRVVERRPLAHSQTCLLRLLDGGWCVDIQAGGGSQNRMIEVMLEDHDGVYRVIAQKGIGIRNRPSFHLSSDPEYGVDNGEVIHTCQRLVLGETTFLRLADGRGWVFDKKHGRQMLEGPLQESANVTEKLSENDAHGTQASLALVDETEDRRSMLKVTGHEGCHTRLMVNLWKMGFHDATLNLEALKVCGGKLESAREWLLARQADSERERVQVREETALAEVREEKRREWLMERQADCSTTAKFAPPSRVAKSITNCSGESSLDPCKHMTSEGDACKQDDDDVPDEDSNAAAAMDDDTVPEEDSNAAAAMEATTKRLSARDRYAKGGRKRDPSRRRSKSANGQHRQKEFTDAKDDHDYVDDSDCGDIDKAHRMGLGDGSAIREPTVGGGVNTTEAADATDGKSSKQRRGRTPRPERDSNPVTDSIITPRRSLDVVNSATPGTNKDEKKEGVPKRRASSRRKTDKL